MFTPSTITQNRSYPSQLKPFKYPVSMQIIIIFFSKLRLIILDLNSDEIGDQMYIVLVFATKFKPTVYYSAFV